MAIDDKCRRVDHYTYDQTGELAFLTCIEQPGNTQSKSNSRDTFFIEGN